MFLPLIILADSLWKCKPIGFVMYTTFYPLDFFSKYIFSDLFIQLAIPISILTHHDHRINYERHNPSHARCKICNYKSNRDHGFIYFLLFLNDRDHGLNQLNFLYLAVFHHMWFDTPQLYVKITGSNGWEYLTLDQNIVQRDWIGKVPNLIWDKHWRIMQRIIENPDVSLSLSNFLFFLLLVLSVVLSFYLFLLLLPLFSLFFWSFLLLSLWPLGSTWTQPAKSWS